MHSSTYHIWNRSCAIYDHQLNVLLLNTHFSHNFCISLTQGV